jgi:TPP-dependent pyruvate/acetoin dehydrogenase alpha subunit
MSVDAGRMKEMLRLMYTIRYFENRACELYTENWEADNFLGALHPSNGQEAVAVGACSCLNDDDYVLSTHRGHGHFIAKGGNVKSMMAELLGKETGCSRGRGGSMHMFDPDKGLMGGNGIVGGGTPLALGPAFAADYRGTQQVTVCFFGDGASSQGPFHEALNLAALWALPVIYICEANAYAVATPTCEAVSVPNVADRAAAYGCPGVSVDGNDLLAVHEAVATAVAHARAGKGPSLLEAVTYRMTPHCMVMNEGRDADEIAQWRDRDPITRFELHLCESGIMDEAQQQDMQQQVAELIADAVTFAQNSPYPDPASVAEGLWAT